MKNRIVAAVLAVMVAGALTACSSGSKTESTTQTTAQATTQAAKETQAKTTETKATEAKTTEAKATEAKTTEAKATEAKTTEAKETEAKATEAKATEAKTTEAAATEAAETEAEKKLPEEAQYTIYNQTGEKVTEIKFTRNDTGKVALDEKSGLADGASTVLKIKKDSTVTDKTSFTFSFTTEGGYAAEYKTLGFEVAPMTLIAEDAKSGATPFKFEAPAEGASTEAEKATEAEATEKVTEKATEAKATEKITEKATEAKATEKVTEKTTEAATEAEEEKKVLPDKAEYTFNNKTGEKVTEIKLVDNTSKKVVEDLKDGLDDGKSVKVSIKKDSSITEKTSYTLTFTTKSGYKAEYKTLGFEVAGINLIAEDAKSGATPIEFIPEAETEAETEAATEAEEEKRELPDKAEYTFNNATGEKVTEIKLVDNTSKKVVEDLKDGLEDGKTVKVSIDKDSSITDKTSYTLTFTTKSGYKAEYKTLGFEVATIKLISEDAKSGATPIEFEK
ncbi:MAG: hypothetical protein MR638_10195 [Lachnospiraceae bacterium]|nr:hypothetical protein [Lachnospiraceae bacterium]